MEFSKSLIIIIAVKLLVVNVAPVVIQESSRFIFTYGLSKISSYIFTSNNDKNTTTHNAILFLTNVNNDRKDDKDDDNIIVNVNKYPSNEYRCDEIIIIDET